MQQTATLDPREYYQDEEYQNDYDSVTNQAYEESSLSAWANSYHRSHKINGSGIPIDHMFEKAMDTGMPLDEELILERPPWWVPIIIIVGLVVIILIVVAMAIYCGLRGTFGEPPATPKKRFDPSDDDARSDQCSSVRLDIRPESRATCASSRAGLSVGPNETTELQTLLVVPSNSQASIQPEHKRLEPCNSLSVDYQKSLSPVGIGPPPPSPASPVAKVASNSAADTQTEDDESTSCSL